MLNLQIIIEGQYVDIRHTHPIAKVGFIYPLDKVSPDVADGLQVSEGGNEFRVHTNGDMFGFDGKNWKRVFNIETVRFVPKKTF